MTRTPARLPPPPVRLKNAGPRDAKPRLVRRKGSRLTAMLAGKVTKWLRGKATRSAYLTGVVHGVLGTSLVVVTAMMASLLSPLALALVLAALVAAFVLSRR